MGDGKMGRVEERRRDVRSCSHDLCVCAVENRRCFRVEEALRCEYRGTTNCCCAEKRGEAFERGHYEVMGVSLGVEMEFLW